MSRPQTLGSPPKGDMPGVRAQMQVGVQVRLPNAHADQCLDTVFRNWSVRGGLLSWIS